MKQSLIPKPKLVQKTKFNHSRNESLKILSFSHEELVLYLQEQMNQNPFLHVTSNTNDADAFLAYEHNKINLYEEIMRQLQLLSVPYQNELCEIITSQLDSNGYFKQSYSQLLTTCGCNKAELDYHLDLLHTLEPYGCYAFDVKDCLALQCRQREEAIAHIALLLIPYLEELALRRFDEVMKKSGLTYEQVVNGFHFIQSLNPKPAANYATDTIYMMPEFKIEVIQDSIRIQRFSDDFTLQVAMNESYPQNEINAFINAQRKQVKNIINSVAKRNMTLLQIMNCICDVQKDFFLKHAPLHHFTLEMAAKSCGLATSTISRALSNKSFEFENRYYPLKKMFSSGGIGDISQDVIKHRMIALINQEDKQHPYSDETLKGLLAKENIHVSRRAVAKYREACYIYNSTKRKKN